MFILFLDDVFFEYCFYDGYFFLCRGDLIELVGFSGFGMVYV